MKTRIVSKNAKNNRLYSNSTMSQRGRILKHFKKIPRLSTMEARKSLGILHPGGRIMELRRQGYKIKTNWIREPDSNGVEHRVGLYIYSGKDKEINNAHS